MLSSEERPLSKLCLSLCAILAGIGGALPQTTPGVTDKEVVIGSCAALGRALELSWAGVEAYFRSVNEEGGINGRKLRLVAQTMILQRPKLVGRS